MKICTLVFALFYTICSYSQDFIADFQLSRTYNIRKDSSMGTAFLIYDFASNENYFVTAKHVLGNVQNNQVVEFYVLKDSVWLQQKDTLFIHSKDMVDIALIKSGFAQKTPAINLHMPSMIIGDEGYFLGFPFGLKTDDAGNMNGGFPYPLVKKCVASGNYKIDGVTVFFLDGHNNPGFSGGPVFFRDAETPNDSRVKLAGVISAYVNQNNKMVTPFGVFNYAENSGIILAYSSKHIKEILEQNGR